MDDACLLDFHTLKLSYLGEENVLIKQNKDASSTQAGMLKALLFFMIQFYINSQWLRVDFWAFLIPCCVYLTNICYKKMVKGDVSIPMCTPSQVICLQLFTAITFKALNWCRDLSA